MNKNKQLVGKDALDKIRILLWDIDGTLMSSVRHGRYKKYFAPTMKKVFGSVGKLEDLQVSGMTDTQIMFEALKDENFTPEMIFADTENLLKVFCREMKEFHRENKNLYTMHEGANKILAETAKSPHFINALLTGNLSCAAEAKLESVGLWHYFKNSPNAFGEISHERKDLAIAAGKLFNETYDFKFEPQQFIVIGDTPNDILCARAFGAKCLIVLTGKNPSKEKLLEHKPDLIIENLSDTEKVRRILETI